jgi:predicted methyltransferase
MNRPFRPTRIAPPVVVLLAALSTFILLAASSRPADATTFDEEIRIIVDWLELKPGSILADIGAGDGQYAIVLSRHVTPGGRVIATGFEQKDRDALAAAVRAATAPNVEVRAASREGTGLPAGCCDAVLARDVYHHFTAPMPAAKSLFATLRPGGRLVVVDSASSGFHELSGRRGIAADELIAQMQAAGFVLQGRLDDWPTADSWKQNDYGLAFSRP